MTWSFESSDFNLTELICGKIDSNDFKSPKSAQFPPSDHDMNCRRSGVQ